MQTTALMAATITAQAWGICVAAMVKITTALLSSLEPSRRLRT